MNHKAFLFLIPIFLSLGFFSEISEAKRSPKRPGFFQRFFFGTHFGSYLSLTRRAVEGDIDAKYELALAKYKGEYKGKEISKSVVSSFYELLDLAKVGHTKGEFLLGYILRYHEAELKLQHMQRLDAEAPIQKDRPSHELAFEFFQKAAKKGHVEAEFELGRILHYEEKLEPFLKMNRDQRQEEGKKWLRSASQKGHEEAKRELQFIEEVGFL